MKQFLSPSASTASEPSGVVLSRRLAQDATSLVEHDVTALARHIEIFAGMLADDHAASPEAAALSEKIATKTVAVRSAMRRFSTFLSSVVDELAPEPTDLAELAEMAWRAARAATQHGGCVALDIRANAAAFVDRSVGLRVLESLFANALEHGGPSVSHVLFAAEPQGDRVVASVSDDGAGVSESLIERVFEPAVRSGAKDGSKAGGGLGLPYCRLAIERHGGAIRAERAGDGCGGLRVSFDLPRA